MDVIRKSLNGNRISKDPKERHHISTPTPLPALSKPLGILPPKKVIRALKDYKSQAPQELSYRKGDFFHVLTDGNGGLWYEAHNPISNARGLVAVENFEEFSKGTPTPRSPKQSSPSDRMSSITSARPTSPKSPLFKTYYAIVLHDFTAERADELDAKSGDAIKVVAQSNREWFVAQPIGRLGRPGLIPVSFVEVHDPVTGKAISDALPLIDSGEVPRVEEWKKSMLNYKANSIALGVLDDSPSQSPTTTMLASSPAEPTITLQGATPLPVVESSQVSPRPSSPKLLPVGILLSAEIKSYHYEAEEYWFRIQATYQPYGDTPSHPLPPAKELLLFRSYNDFYDFQVELLDMFPYEAGRPDTSTRILPYMPGPVDVVDNEITMSRRDELDEYLHKLCALKSYARYILEDPLVRSFCSLKPGDGEVNLEPRRGEMEALRRSYDQEARGYVDDSLATDQMARLRVSQRHDNRLSDASRYEDDERETIDQSSKGNSYYASHRRTESTNSQRHPPRTHTPHASSQSYSRTQSPVSGGLSRSRTPLEIDPHEAKAASQSSRSSSHDPSPVSMRSSQAASVRTAATSASGRSRSASNAAYNPPISATNSATAFVKIKIFDRMSDDLVAIRVHPKVTHAQLLDKAQERLGSNVLAFRYRDSLSNELKLLENDDDVLRRWLNSTDRHVLYAE